MQLQHQTHRRGRHNVSGPEDRAPIQPGRLTRPAARNQPSKSALHVLRPQATTGTTSTHRGLWQETPDPIRGLCPLCGGRLRRTVKRSNKVTLVRLAPRDCFSFGLLAGNLSEVSQPGRHSLAFPNWESRSLHIYSGGGVN